MDPNASSLKIDSASAVADLPPACAPAVASKANQAELAYACGSHGVSARHPVAAASEIAQASSLWRSGRAFNRATTKAICMSPLDGVNLADF
jgi:hypothetical protein